jgi:hypothetical protein
MWSTDGIILMEKLNYYEEKPSQQHFVYQKSRGNEIIRVHWE